MCVGGKLTSAHFFCLLSAGFAKREAVQMQEYVAHQGTSQESWKTFCYRKLNFNSRGRLTVVGTNFLWATRISSQIHRMVEHAVTDYL